MDFAEFKNKIYRSYGLDLNSYKETQLKRRLDSLLVRKKIAHYGEYLQLIGKDKNEYVGFLDYLTINVSEFFRDLKIFQVLEKQIMPDLLTNKRNYKLKIWSAACSIGAEPYSVAMILADFQAKNYVIDATDLDQTILKKATEGIYTKDAVKNVSSERITRYFTKVDDKYAVQPAIKTKISFKKHDLLSDSYSKGYDLIICRNVTIYFTREAQEKITKKFVQSLNLGGYYFIGGSETIFNYAELGLKKVSPCFYQKVAN